MPSFEDLEDMIHRQYEETTAPENNLGDEQPLDSANRITNDNEQPVITANDRRTDPHIELRPESDPAAAEESREPGRNGTEQDISGLSREELGSMLRSLSSENKVYLKAMTPQSQGIAGKLFDCIRGNSEGRLGVFSKLLKPHSIELPKLDTNSIFAKLDILTLSAKLWLKEGPVAKKGQKIIKLADQISALEEDILEAEQDIAHAENGEEKRNYQLQIRTLLVKKNKLEEKLSPLQDDYQEKVNEIKLIINDRDAVAKDMVERYDQDIKPLDSQIESMESKRDKIDGDAEKMELNHQQQEKILETMEKAIEEKEKRLRRQDFSEGDIRKTLEPRRKKIIHYREIMRLQKKGLEISRKEVNITIADKDAQAANPRSKKRYFAAITRLKPSFDTDIVPLRPIGRIASPETIQSHRV